MITKGIHNLTRNFTGGLVSPYPYIYLPSTAPGSWLSLLLVYESLLKVTLVHFDSS